MHRLSFISWRYWCSHPTRLLSCLGAVALIVAVSLPVGLMAASVYHSHEQSLGLASHSDLQVVSSVDEGMQALWQDALKEVSGVAEALPSLNRQGILIYEGEQLPVSVQGVGGSADALPKTLSGRAVVKLERGTVMVSSALADALDLRLNTPVEMVTPKGFRTYYVVGIFESAGRGLLAHSLIASLGEVQTSYAGGERLVSLFDIQLVKGADPVEVKAALEARLGAAASVHKIGERTRGLTSLLEGAGVLLLLILIFTFLASSYLLLSNLSLMFVERQQQFTHLKALGLGPAALQSWLRLELSWVFVTGTGLGIGLAGFLVGIFADMLQTSLLAQSIHIYDLFLAPEAGLLSLSMLVSLIVLSAFYLKRQLSRSIGEPPYLAGAGHRLRRRFIYATTCASALGFSLIAAIPMAWTKAAYATALQLVCLLLFLLCLTYLIPSLSSLLSYVVGRWHGSPAWLWLSAGLLKRHRKHSGVAVASLIVSLTMLTGVFGVAYSYRSSLKTWADSMYNWDLLVSQRTLGVQTEVPISEDLQWELAVVPGVSLVSADVWPSIRQGRLNANLYVFDMTNFPYKRSFVSLEGVSSEKLPEILREGRNVAISRSLARSQDLRVGSGLSLLTPTGEYPYDVVAVVDDIGAAANSIFIDRQTYLVDWRNENVDLFTIALSEEANREQVATLIREQLSTRYDLEVKSVDEYRAQLNEMVSDTFGFSQVLVLLFVGIAALGLINVGLESLHYLRREFAILNALGARVSLIRTMLLAEVIFNGVLGVLAGLTLGSLLSNILVRGVQLSSRFTVVWYVPVTAYVTLALAALCVVIVVGTVTLRSVRRLEGLTAAPG